MLRAAISSTSRSVLRRSCASNGTLVLLPAAAAASPSFFTPSPSIRRWTPQQFSTSAASAGSTAAAVPRVPQNASDAAERTLQRFWKSVSVQAHPAAPAPPPGAGELPAHYTIHLDKRALRTPSGNVMRIPIEQGLLAGLVAQEWHEQRTVLKPHALPLTSLVARSIDGLTSDSVRKGVCEGLMHYLDTDTILFHEDEPHQLVRLQDERWQPLLDWTSSHFKTPITIYKSLFNTSQSPETRSVLLAHIQTMTPLRLAAFERAVLSSKSFLVALGLLEGKLSVDDASRAAEVEVASQIERWGEVEDTHDVDYHDIRRQLGSVSIVLAPPADQQL
ncbi:hypothetical protein CF327_g2305 [Tilletia walkeri]|uniref:ATP synthase mitochondrial F1 complex assembly factor 2 n=1 Tax=Tilletia walkeri TaxID=117179 RepID=A0A8X7T6R2_9BASI|nr:hypothetical protein CF327_g2305 [Tilletia walkeri]KAE8270896.1 hypothetical protein A4X09_0g1461 [Tilletia walkeri]